MKFILERSKLFIFLIIILMLVGALTFMKLNKREIPETPASLIQITAVYPGASPAEVEEAMTNPLENELKKMEEIDSIQSVSADSASVITAELKDGVSQEDATGKITQHVQRASGSFPDGVQEPTVDKLEMTSPLISYMFYTENGNAEDLDSYLQAISDKISGISGVAGSKIKGIPDKEVVVKLDGEKLGEKGIQPFEVIEDLKKANQPVALGSRQMDDRQIRLTYRQEEGLEKLKKTEIGQSGVPLEDLGSVKLEERETEDIVSYEGKKAVSFTVNLQAGQDIPGIDGKVGNVMDDFKEDIPDGWHLTTYESQAEEVADVFSGLYVSLLIAVLAVLLVTTAGLTLYGSFAVAFTVLASVLIGLIPIPFMGVDLNQISVIGLIIAIGILVDDSIVVNDNIQRRFKLGDSPLAGSINGVKEVYSSIISSSLAIVVTFSPLLLLSGGNGAFIKALPSILITTIIASTVLAVMLVPMLQFIRAKRKKGRISSTPGFLGKPLEKLAVFYSRTVLKKVLSYPVWTGVLGLVIATGLLLLAFVTPFEFFPEADKEEVTVNVRLPEGTAIEATDRFLTGMMDEVVSEDQHVTETAVFTGDGLPGLFAAQLERPGSNTGQGVFRIDREETSASSFIDKWQDELRERHPDAEIFLKTIVQGPPVGAPVTVTVKGEDIGQLKEMRDKLKREMLAEGADVVTDDLGDEIPAVEYVPDEGKLQQYGISKSTALNQLQLITQGIPMSSLYVRRTPYDVVLAQNGGGAKGSLDLSSVKLPAAGGEGPPALVGMDELFKTKETKVLAQIPHDNAKRSVELKAYGDGGDFKSAMSEVADSAKEKARDGYDIIVGGENSDQQDFFAEIGFLFLIVLLLVYLVIAFQFRSFLLPFLVMIAVYLGVSGAVLGLFITRTPLSFLGVMGMVSLTGIVVRNAVVLIDFVEERRRNGEVKIHEAIIDSGHARIKPIILTSLTSIAALVPVALTGDPLFQPLAVTIIAGLAFSGLFTLLMIPALYLLFYRMTEKGRKPKETEPPEGHNA